MSDILSIGAGATQLYRQSLATVSNNIADLLEYVKLILI